MIRRNFFICTLLISLFSCAYAQEKGNVLHNVSESVIEDVSESVIEDVFESVVEDVTESVIEDVTESVTEDVTESVTEDVTESVVEIETEVITESVSEELSEEVSEEVSEEISTDVDSDNSEISDFLNVSRETLSLLSELVEERSAYDSYRSTIPEPYLSYCIDIALSRAPLSHYVAFVDRVSSGNYSTNVYCVAVGDLSYSSSQFFGDVTIFKFFQSPSNVFPQYTATKDSSFILTTSQDLVFTDLSSDFPDFTVRFSWQAYIFYILVFMVIVWTFMHFRRK